MPTNDSARQYKIVILIGGELNNIQVVVDKDEHEFKAVVPVRHGWETIIYKEKNLNQYEFLLQE